MLSKLSRRLTRKLHKSLTRSFSALDKKSTNDGGRIQFSSRLQFSRDKLVDFGELERGEIPDALLVDRESNLTSLDNGVRVCTERYDNGLVTVGFHWTFGSRNETPETSGVCHALQNMWFRGTENRTRTEVENDLKKLGARINFDSTRERTSVIVTIQPENLEDLFELFGDLFSNSTLHKQQLQAEKENIFNEIVEIQRDQFETTREAAYYTAFRDHMFGQPKRGNKDNLSNISTKDLKRFSDNNVLGSNLVVVASGAVDHKNIEELTVKNLGHLNSGENAEKVNSEKPMFTPSLMFMRDDEMANINTVNIFRAPNYEHEDAFAMYFFKDLIGSYRADLHTAKHLNSPQLQYNSFHTLLGENPDITIHKSFYEPYSDVGIFGNYVFGNEVFGTKIIFMSPYKMSDYADFIDQSEIYRARATIFNNLLNETSGEDVNTSIANQVIYLGRRVPRSERARRYSAIGDQDHLQKVAKKWFWDVDVACSAWGVLHHVMKFSVYNRVWKRATLGWNGNSHLM